MNRTDTGGNGDIRSGVVLGLLAYTMWGVFPVYFKWLAAVAPLEVLSHRVIWAVIFGALIITGRRQWREVGGVFVDRSQLAWLAIAAICISLNWLIYIWAVQQERIFETSLGYYINPLMYVAVGIVLFGERLRRLQIAAVASAGTGVTILAVSGGVLPWVALSLAALFTAYGVIRKRVAIGAMPGLFIETVLLAPFAVALLWTFGAGGDLAFGQGDTKLSLLLSLGGPVTVMPLLLFAIAARRLPLTTIGFMQFLAPTLQFFTGIYYGEALTTAHIVCFALIWTAAGFFSYDALRASKKPLPSAPAEA